MELVANKKRYFTIILYIVVLVFLVLFSVFFLVKIFDFPLVSDDFTLGMDAGSFRDRLDRLDNPIYARGPLFFVLVLSLFFKGFSDYHYAHIVVGIMHLLTCLGFVFLAKKLWNNANPLILIALFFFMVINPLSNHSTMWILQSYPIFTLFFGVYAALSLLAFEKTKKVWWIISFIVLSLLSILSNEQGLLMLPMYMAIVAYTREGDILKNIINFKIQIPIFFMWGIPYLAYRIYLYVFYDSISAVSIYKKFYGGILTVFPKLIEKLLECLPLTVYVVLTISILVVSFFYKKVYGKELKMITLFIPYILILLSPFSLLNGYITERFFYISGIFFVFMVFWIIHLSLNIFKNRRWIHVLLSIALVTISLYFVKQYDQESLVPIKNMKYYVDHFLKERESLPKDAVILLDVVEPAYTLPKNWLATYSFRDRWSMESMNTLFDGNVHLLQYFENDGGTIKTGYFPQFLTIVELNKMVNTKIYVYHYNGKDLTKIEGSKIQFIDSDNTIVKEMVLE